MALLSLPLAISVLLSFTGSDSPSAPYDCEGEPVDLRQAGKSMEGIPFLDQGDLTVCAPYTASALVDAWRIREGKRSLKPGERSSPTALAIEYAAWSTFPYSFPLQNSTDPLSREKFRWGGIVCVFVAAAREIGVCSDDVLHETQGRSLEALTKSEILYRLLRDYQGLKPKKREEKRPSFGERIHTILSTLPPVIEPSLLPSRAKIQEELALFTGDDPYVPLARLLLKPCDGKRAAVANLPVCHTLFDAGLDAYGWSRRPTPFRRPATFERVRELLGREHPLPVAIAYCHRVLRRGKSYAPESILSDGCGQHWSLIIGKRQKEGRCQLLVRNTDGGRASGVSPDWENDRGDLWVDARTLMSSVYALEWLD